MNTLAAESANPLLPPVGEIIVGTITFAIAFFVLGQVRLAALRAGLPGPPRGDRGRHRAGRVDAGRGQARWSSTAPSWPRPRTEAAQIRDQARAEGSRSSRSCGPRPGGVGADRRPRRGAAGHPPAVVNELRGQIGRLAVDLAGRVVGESLRGRRAAAARSTASSTSSTAWPPAGAVTGPARRRAPALGTSEGEPLMEASSRGRSRGRASAWTSSPGRPPGCSRGARAPDRARRAASSEELLAWPRSSSPSPGCSTVRSRCAGRCRTRRPPRPTGPGVARQLLSGRVSGTRSTWSRRRPAALVAARWTWSRRHEPGDGRRAGRRGRPR
jgi:F-type H+-transporting ATPase subunit b